MEKVEKKISELEQQVIIPEMPALPTNLEKWVEVTDGSVTAYYCASISGLPYQVNESRSELPSSVTAQKVELGRYEKQVINEVQRQMQLFPPRLIKKTVQREEMKNIWNSIFQDPVTFFVDTVIKEYKPLVIFQDGVSYLEYRSELQKKILSEHKVKVSQELLSLVFDPLNKQIEDWYLQVRDWKREKEELMSLK